MGGAQIKTTDVGKEIIVNTPISSNSAGAPAPYNSIRGTLPAGTYTIAGKITDRDGLKITLKTGEGDAVTYYGYWERKNEDGTTSTLIQELVPDNDTPNAGYRMEIPFVPNNPEIVSFPVNPQN
jgi:hypothetical protein